MPVTSSIHIQIRTDFIWHNTLSFCAVGVSFISKRIDSTQRLYSASDSQGLDYLPKVAYEMQS